MAGGRTGAASSLAGRLVGSAISLLCIIRGGGSQWLITAWRTLCLQSLQVLSQRSWPAPASGLWRGDTSPAWISSCTHQPSAALSCTSCCTSRLSFVLPGLRRRGRCPARVAAPVEGWLYPTWAGSPGPRAAPFQVRGFPKQCSNADAEVGVLWCSPLERLLPAMLVALLFQISQQLEFVSLAFIPGNAVLLTKAGIPTGKHCWLLDLLRKT